MKRNSIIVGMGRIGGYILNEIYKDVGAVVVRNLEFGDNAYDIQLEKSNNIESIPEPKYSEDNFIPAFVNLEEAIEKMSGVDEIVIFDVSTSENFRNNLNKLEELARGRYKHLKFRVCSCTPDQDGKTREKISSLKNIDNLKIVRDDLELREVKDAIKRNYFHAQKIGGRLIVTDVHISNKEPWAAILKSMVDKLLGKESSNEIYNDLLTYNRMYDAQDRKAFPVDVDKYLSISSFRSIDAGSLSHETAFIIECIERNGKACTIDEKGHICNSIVFAKEKYGGYVANRMIELSKKISMKRKVESIPKEDSMEKKTKNRKMGRLI